MKPVHEWEKGEEEVLSLQERIKKLEAILTQKKQSKIDKVLSKHE